MESKVSKLLLENVLDFIFSSNGVRKCEIAKQLKIAQSTAFACVQKLVNLNCISEGVVQYFKGDGTISLKTGYFYEQGLPDTFITRECSSTLVNRWSEV